MAQMLEVPTVGLLRAEEELLPMIRQIRYYFQLAQRLPRAALTPTSTVTSAS
jgi:hypothetical protein